MPPIVLDTNTLLSAALFPNSIVYKAYKKARNNYRIVLSPKIWAEATEVFKRPKFDKYVGLEYRLIFLEALKRTAIFIEPNETITDCRDPKDNKFLELAVASDAQFIVTGDDDLLVLNPYRGITILKSGDFLALELT
jgi:uncharacterized protein